MVRPLKATLDLACVTEARKGSLIESESLSAFQWPFTRFSFQSLDTGFFSHDHHGTCTWTPSLFNNAFGSCRLWALCWHDPKENVATIKWTQTFVVKRQRKRLKTLYSVHASQNRRMKSPAFSEAIGSRGVKCTARAPLAFSLWAKNVWRLWYRKLLLKNELSLNYFCFCTFNLIILLVSEFV